MWPFSMIKGGDKAMMSPVTRTSTPSLEAIEEDS